MSVSSSTSNAATDAVNDAPTVYINGPDFFPVTSEFLVNQQVQNYQERPAIFGLSDGRIVIVWSDHSGTLGDNSSASIKGRIFSATGEGGTEFLINSETTGAQALPALTELSGGGFVVTWQDSGKTLGDTSETSIKARIFDEFGAAEGPEFLVNSQTASYQFQPQVTALDGDRFVITWYDDSGTLGDSSGFSIKARMFEGTGTPVAGDFLVNQNTANFQFWPNITTLSDGRFIIVWHDNSYTLGDSQGNSAKGRIYSATGAPLTGDFLINTSTDSDQREPAVAALDNGGFVVTWEDGSNGGGDGSYWGIKAQLFDAAGAKVGGEFLVNTNYFGDQRNPIVAGLEGGGFVITWRDPSGTLGDPDSQSIKARVYDALGTPIGDEFLVNEGVAYDQQYPVVTALPGGGFAISWHDQSGTLGDESGLSVKAKIYGAPGFAVTEQVAQSLKGTIAVDDVDAGAGEISVLLSVSSGVLDVSPGDSGADVSGSGTNAVTVTGTLAEVQALLGSDPASIVTYTADSDAPPATATLSVTVDDNGNSGTNSEAASATRNSTIYITDVNDSPTVVLGKTDVNGKEDSDVVFSAALGNEIVVADPDGTPLTVTLSVSEGTLTLKSTDGLQVSGDGTKTVTVSGSAAGINSALDGLVYRGKLNFEGEDVLKVSVSDGEAMPVSQTVTITLADDGVVNGSAGSDTLTGSGGADRFEAGAGADEMTGLGGDDVYTVDDPGDVVTEAADEGRDSVRSSIDYTLPDNVEVLKLTGTGDTDGTGNDLDNTLLGNSGANLLVGGLGDDTLSGAAGADTMIGGMGNDVYVVDEGGDVVTEEAGEGIDTVYASIAYTLPNDVEYLTLMGTDDIDATGNALSNSISGNSGNNRLDGGAGADAMFGGAGDDLYIVDHDSDKAKETNAAGGFDTVESSVSFTLEAHLEKLVLTGTANIFGTGNADVNEIVGNSGNNTLNGAGGADTMRGGLGNDTYAVDDVGDVVAENPGEGVDSVNSHISYALGANVEYLYLMGTANLDGSGNELDNWIEGNRGDNVLDGGAGADMMRGGDGNDTYIVNEAGDRAVELRAAGGLDTVKSSVSFTLGSHVENLVLTGSGNVNGTGNEIGNEITGNDGNNVIRGNLGADRLTGGLGNDTFAYADRADSNLAGGIDTVLDFTTGDKVDLSAIDAKSFTGANEAFSFVGSAAFKNVAGELRAEDKGGYWQVEGDVNGDGAADFVLHVVLADADPITGADFVL